VPGPPPDRRWIQWAGIASAVVVAVFLIVMVLVCLPRPIDPPTSFSTFSDYKQLYTCDAPGGWDVSKDETRPGGVDAWSSDTHEVRYTKGDAAIVVTSYNIDLLGDKASGMHAVSLAPGWDMDAPGGFHSPVAVLHGHGLDRIQEQMIGYAELVKTDTLPSTTTTSWDDYSWNEWKASGREYHLPHPMRGYLFCATGARIGVTVACVCPAEDWSALSPAFQRIIESVAEPSTGQSNSTLMLQSLIKSIQPSGGSSPGDNE
jgi:hypothetical protein